MKEPIDSSYSLDMIIDIQRYMLEYIDGIIISIQVICGKTNEKENLIAILESFKNETVIDEFKKIASNLIFFVKSDKCYRGKEVIKPLIAIRKGIEVKAKKLIKISEKMKQ
ncbi:MAG: hypothetical protein PHP54_02425 [Clostridia bacterium]|nr:hypothetical protein [Clostridia bacterium]